VLTNNELKDGGSLETGGTRPNGAFTDYEAKRGYTDAARELTAGRSSPGNIMPGTQPPSAAWPPLRRTEITNLHAGGTGVAAEGGLRSAKSVLSCGPSIHAFSMKRKYNGPQLKTPAFLDFMVTLDRVNVDFIKRTETVGFFQ